MDLLTALVTQRPVRRTTLGALLLMIPACAQYGYAPSQPLNLTSENFDCVMDRRSDDGRTAAITPFAYRVEITENGRRAKLHRDGRVISLGYDGLMSSRTWENVRYMGRSAGRWVIIGVPRGEDDGYATYAASNASQKITGIYIGECR